MNELLEHLKKVVSSTELRFIFSNVPMVVPFREVWQRFNRETSWVAFSIIQETNIGGRTDQGGSSEEVKNH